MMKLNHQKNQAINFKRHSISSPQYVSVEREDASETSKRDIQFFYVEQHSEDNIDEQQGTKHKLQIEIMKDLSRSSYDSSDQEIIEQQSTYMQEQLLEPENMQLIEVSDTEEGVNLQDVTTADPEKGVNLQDLTAG